MCVTWTEVLCNKTFYKFRENYEFPKLLTSNSVIINSITT